MTEIWRLLDGAVTVIRSQDDIQVPLD